MDTGQIKLNKQMNKETKIKFVQIYLSCLLTVELFGYSSYRANNQDIIRHCGRVVKAAAC